MHWPVEQIEGHVLGLQKTIKDKEERIKELEAEKEKLSKEVEEFTEYRVKWEGLDNLTIRDGSKYFYDVGLPEIDGMLTVEQIATRFKVLTEKYRLKDQKNFTLKLKVDELTTRAKKLENDVFGYQMQSERMSASIETLTTENQTLTRKVTELSHEKTQMSRKIETLQLAEKLRPSMQSIMQS